MENREKFWNDRREMREKFRAARHERKERYWAHRKEHHPMVSTGLFFIVLGLALLAATNDVLNLGDWRRYFTWEIALIFVGVLLLVNLKFVGGILAIAAGSWFLLENLYVVIPTFIKTIYWPGVIILLGIGFIISSIVKRKREIN
jgi:hypothetical protein